jgi:molybdenum cofactor biosynthesis protein A
VPFVVNNRILQKPGTETLKTSGTITDSFGRVHDYLRISLTERCNLRCFYCMPEEGISLRPRDKFMNKDEVIAIAKTFAGLGIKKIRLTGGEPLIRRDAAEIISGLSELPIELAITTNGILVDRFMDVFLNSGLRSVNVSLDSLQKNKLNAITRRDHYDKILSNITLLLKNNYHVKLNAVIIRGVNDDELGDFVAFTKDRNVHFRFIEFMPFDGNKWDQTKCVTFKEMLSDINSKYPGEVQRIEDPLNSTAKNFRINGYKGSFAFISSVSNPFCDTCNRIRLTADGKLKNCLFSNSETDLLTPLRQGSDLRPLIMDSLLHKKFRRGGLNTLTQFSDPLEHSLNRAMPAIGG